MNNFYIIEIQSNSDGTSGFIQYGFADKGSAEDSFHTLCISARQSQVMIHTVMFINNKGELEKPSECYVHPVEQSPEGETA